MSIIYIFIALLAAVGIERFIYERCWPRGLKAQMCFDRERAVEGDTVELLQTIEYTGRLPLPWVRIKFRVSRDLGMPRMEGSSVTDHYNCEEIFSVRRMEKITRRIPVKCSKRGYHTVSDIDAVSSDILLTNKLVAGFGGNAAITVYPCRTEIPQIIDTTHQIIGELVVRQSRAEDPFMFRGVREYIHGDPLSRINWRATARSGQLAVNQYDCTSDLCVSIWLNIEEHNDRRDHSLVEECIRIAATLIGTLIDDGYPVALCCNGRYSYTDDFILIGHGCSPEHKDTCLTALARLDIEKDAMPSLDFIDAVPRTAGDSELVMVISPETGEKLCSRVKEAAGKRELFWIAPVRNDDVSHLPCLSKIKNNCVWGVVCER